jgi:hypothetical protein
MAPSTDFTKRWRIQNVGTCTWTTKYAFVFVSGKRMKGDGYYLPGKAKPDAIVELPVDMVAPDTDGDYQGNWGLKIGNTLFGDGNKPFTVKIKVVTDPVGTIFNFVNGYCTAQWKNNYGKVLPCPGKIGLKQGFVVKESDPELEDDGKTYAKGIWTHPPFSNFVFDPILSQFLMAPAAPTAEKWIQGSFPAIIIRDNDHFKAEAIGCVSGFSNCNVRFQVRYKLPNQDIETLVSQTQTHDGTVGSIDEDLSSLANKYVTIYLRIIGLSSTSHNAAMWIQPKIYRETSGPYPYP